MLTPVPLASHPVVSESRLGPEHSIRVVLGNDHARMRRNLRLLLDGEPGVEVIAEAADLSTVMSRVDGALPDVVVIDLGMYNGSSIEAIRALRQQIPGLKIVALTMKVSHMFAQQALDAGAIGFVLTDRADGELPDAVRSAARGEEYVSPYVAQGLGSLRRRRAALV